MPSGASNVVLSPVRIAGWRGEIQYRLTSTLDQEQALMSRQTQATGQDYITISL